jgi:hypothetical protein
MRIINRVPTEQEYGQDEFVSKKYFPKKMKTIKYIKKRIA